MEKLDKRKVLAAVLIIALFAAVVSTVSLIYNSIEIFVDSGKSEVPLTSGILLLFGTLVSCLGIGAGIAAFITRASDKQKLCVILEICAAVYFLLSVIVLVGVYCSSKTYRSVFTLSIALILQQLVYFAVAAVALFINFKLDKKQAAVPSQTVGEAAEPSETDEETK